MFRKGARILTKRLAFSAAANTDTALQLPAQGEKRIESVLIIKIDLLVYGQLVTHFMYASIVITI